MVKTVVREFKFDPNSIDELYSDSCDYLGLEYWDNDAHQMHEELKKK